MKEFTRHHLNNIGQVLFDKKGFNILALDVRGLSTITDYYLIVEGSVDRHVVALAEAVMQSLKDEGITPLHLEGKAEGEWVVVDYMQCVVHLFTPQMREKYRLEELWQAAKVVELSLDVSHSIS